MHELFRRLRYLFTRDSTQDELADELQLHLDLRTLRNIEQGMSPDAARREATRKLGNTIQVQESAQDVWIAAWFDQFWQDLKFGARWLKRSPGFTAVIVLTLAIGIGVNTTMFSVVHAVLLQPLPYPSADRLIWIANSSPACMTDCFNSRADFKIWEAKAKSFERMAAYGNLDLAMVRGSNREASTERVAFVTPHFWTMSGANPAIGRLPNSDEVDAMVLSWTVYEREFGGNPSVIGSKVSIEGRMFDITGVLHRDFRFLFPQELNTGDEVRDIGVYVPLPEGHETPGDAMRPNPQIGPVPAWVRVVGRLRPGASLEQARAELIVIHEALNKEYPSLFRKKSLNIQPLADRIVGESRLALLVLLGAVGFVLVIACANVANLLMARASVRRKEIAIRAALGAGQSRVIRQFVTESLLLAFLGGAAGLVLARATLFAVVHWGAQAIPRIEDTAIDLNVLGFTVVVTMLTGVLFGLAPASTMRKQSLDEVLREDAKSTSSSFHQQNLRALLVSTEIALAVVLLTGAGLLLRSFWRMNTYPAGFTPEKILVMKVSLAGGKYFRNWPQQDVYIRQLVERVEKTAGVEAVGIDCGAIHQSVKVSGTGNEDASVAVLRAVSPGYLPALGATLTRGRWPTAEELFDVVLINQSMAWKAAGVSQDPVGKQITGSFLRGAIAGVVGDFKDHQLDSQPAPQVFIPYQKSPVIGSIRVVIRTSGNPSPLIAILRDQVSAIDREVPVMRIQTLEQELYDSIAFRRFSMFLLAGFAVTALLLALVGIYGVISYIVVQRTREIGIRMALGAQRRDIVTIVARHGVRITLIGLAAGLLVSIVLTRIMASMIYDLSTTDPMTLGAVGLILGITAFLACCRPAYQAALLDPLVALRKD
jgi:predicted permease